MYNIFFCHKYLIGRIHCTLRYDSLIFTIFIAFSDQPRTNNSYLATEWIYEHLLNKHIYLFYMVGVRLYMRVQI